MKCNRAAVFKRRNKGALVLCLALAVVFVIALAPQKSMAQAKAPKTLKIGYLLCVSDWFSVFDALEERNLKTVARIANERGGITIKGEKYNIELVGEDGKSTMDGVASAAAKLVFDRKVKFVVGPQGFFTTASGPIFEQNGVMHVSGFNTLQPGEMDKSTPFGFLGFNAAVGSAIASFKIIKKEYPKAKKVAVIIADDGAIPYLMPAIKKQLERNGLSMAGDYVPFPNQMEDFSPIAAKVNAIKDADVVYMQHGSPVAVGLVVKGLRSLGNMKPFIHQGAPHVRELLAVCGKEAGHEVISLGPTPHAPGNPPLLDEIYDKSSMQPSESFYLLVPNGLWALIKVIEAAQSTDPAVVKAKWESMDKVECIYSKTCYLGGDETYGMKHHAIGHPMSYSKLVNGKPVFGGWVEVGRIP